MITTQIIGGFINDAKTFIETKKPGLFNKVNHALSDDMGTAAKVAAINAKRQVQEGFKCGEMATIVAMSAIVVTAATAMVDLLIGSTVVAAFAAIALAFAPLAALETYRYYNILNSGRKLAVLLFDSQIANRTFTPDQVSEANAYIKVLEDNMRDQYFICNIIDSVMLKYQKR